ncbi:MAG TPA: hypothetical protein VK813_00500 [Edaphobacter sp.]|jgi:hypothetical protein|nr:hypothetical protein [Edaphobacter sp.]
MSTNSEVGDETGKEDFVSNEVSGNVRITTLPDGLIVTIPATRPASSAVLPGLLCAFLLYMSGGLVHELLNNLNEGKAAVLPGVVLLIFSWMVFQLSRLLFGRREVLRCTNEDLNIIKVDFGYAWRRRSFLRQDIKGIEFVAVGFSRYGSVTGLRFNTAGKQIKLLRGLRSVEAQTILTKLSELGFDTGTRSVDFDAEGDRTISS